MKKLTNNKQIVALQIERKNNQNNRTLAKIPLSGQNGTFLWSISIFHFVQSLVFINLNIFISFIKIDKSVSSNKQKKMVKSSDRCGAQSKESETIDSDGSSTDQMTNTNNGHDFDPLESMDTLIEPIDSQSMDKEHEPTDDDAEKNPSNGGNAAKVVSDFEPKIRLVPITSLLTKNVPKSSSMDSIIVDLDCTTSDSDDDQPLKKLVKSSNKITLKTENRRDSNETYVAHNNASKPKSNKSNTNHINGHKSNKSDIVVPVQFNVMVNLNPLPKRMENALKKFNLSEIRDHKSRVVASSKV